MRCRNAPVTKAAFNAAIGDGQGVEYLAEILRNALFVSQGHRDDAVLTLVLEKSADFSRAVSLRGDQLGSVQDLHEAGLLAFIADSLAAGEGLAKEAETTAANGAVIQATSFEKLVKMRTESSTVFVLSPKGDDIREQTLPPDAVFVMTDHTPMPKNTYKSMQRQGVKPMSLGPVVLHASQCISLIHNEIDRLDSR